MSYLFHPSGSLPYHLRAWRWRHSLWEPFRAEVRRWLTDWRPQVERLVLVGPSGGYALSSQFLERFRHIEVLEPDPLARWILRRRFPEFSFTWHDSLWLPQPGGFSRLAATFPGAAFLFCNLLGQELQGQSAGFSRSAWLAELESAMAGRAWASWHDLASTARAPASRSLHCLDQAISLDDLLAKFWLGGVLEIVDHETASLCPHTRRRYCVWHLAPKSYHLVEWLSCPDKHPCP